MAQAPPPLPAFAPRSLPRSDRPGALVALAVLNFVFGGGTLLGALINFAQLPAGGGMPAWDQSLMNAPPPPGLAKFLEWMTPTPEYLWATSLLGLIAGVLMVLSGIGYLRQKKFLGRTLGNAFAVVAIIGVVVGLSLSKLGFFLIPGMAYPVITLVMVNTTLRKDFIN